MPYWGKNKETGIIEPVPESFVKKWQPSMYNTRPTEVVDHKGRKRIKKMPTTPKVKEGSNICPNLLSMNNDFAKEYVLYNTLCHRRSFIQSTNNEEKGILNHPRLAVDGRLPAGANTIGTSTKRCSHRTVVNIPSGAAVFGHEMRAMFTAPKGFYLVGWDAAALEKRMEAHESFQFDGGVYAKELLEGDTHTATAKAMSEVAGRVVSRSEAKSLSYAVAYGCGADKLARMLDVPSSTAKDVIDAFWETNWATKAALDFRVKEWVKSGKKYISDITGAPIHIRSEHSIFNARLQSSGSLVMKLAHCLFMDNCNADIVAGNVELAAHMHDEAQVCVRKDLVEWTKVANEDEAAEAMKHKLYGKPVNKNGQIYLPYCRIGEEGVKGIIKAGEILKLNVPLDGNYMVGLSWDQTH